VSTIDFDHVDLVLGRKRVLSAVDLKIPQGAFVGVLGPNGAGKTTLIRAVLGLVAPVHGNIRVLGAPARRGNPEIGYLPQTHGAMPLGLRGRDFVTAAVGGHRWGMRLPARNERREVDRVLGLVGAMALAESPLAALSGGERQRILLAAALLGAPRLLLLDEPLMSLDPHRQGEVVALVRGLQRRLGLTVLFSAHDLNPLLGALDLVLYLGGGKAALGQVDEVITGPVLSRLYGVPIDVARVGSRVFVMTGSNDIEHEEHPHETHHHV